MVRCRLGGVGRPRVLLRTCPPRQAMENIEANFEGTKLARQYKVPKMTYKGTEACPQ